VGKKTKRLVRAGAVLAGALVFSALLPTGTAGATENRYDAESAKLFQAVVATNHTGFDGAGFVDYTNMTGGYIEWTVSVPSAGTATLVIQYANGGTADRPMSVSVNGTVVAANVSFPGTGSWDTWKSRALTATLKAGTNTVRTTATVAAGGPNVDYLDATPNPPATIYEAENATISQGTIASNHTGFSGTGFVDYTNVVGGYVEFTVTATTAGPVGLQFSYANGATANRPMTVTVNGTPVAIDAPFGPTANWDTWTSLLVTGRFTAGTNKVRATATGAMGGPNLDSLHIAPPPPGAPAAWELRARAAACGQISNGLYKTDVGSSSATVPVCARSGAVFWKADLDVDCSGPIVAGDTCDPTASDYQPDTFCHSSKNAALDSSQIPYVTVPSPSSTWDFRTRIQCGSIVAVISGDTVFYAVVGDTGPTMTIGAASYATAKGLGNVKGFDSGVTYLVFTQVNPNTIEDHAAAVATGQRFAHDLVNAS
jgi:hypothetical protein